MTTQEILEEALVKGGERVVLDEELHVTADGRVVPATDPAGRFVLGGAGGSIPAGLARRLGIGPAPPQTEDDVPVKPVERTDAKMVHAAENKAVGMGDAKAKSDHK